MTPPPITTTRARLGTCLAVRASGPVEVGSVIAHRLRQEPLEVRTVELRHRPVVLLHRPGPEVVVERAHRALDRAPERPSVLRHQRPEPGPRDPMTQQTSVVGL